MMRSRSLLLCCLLFAPAAFQCTFTDDSCAISDAFCNPVAVDLLYTQALEAEPETLLAVGSTGGVGVVYETQDGINWQRRATLPDAMVLLRIARAGSRLVIVGRATPFCYIATSDDEGYSWTRRDCGSGNSALSGIATGNGQVVAVGQNDGSSAIARVSYDNGTTWSDPANLPANTSFNGLEFYKGSFWTASDQATNGVFESADPATVAFASNTPVAGNYNAPALFSGRVYTTNSTNLSLHGYDGTSWSTSSGLFANRPVDEMPGSIAHMNGTTLVAGFGLTPGTSTCFIDYSTDEVNFQGGGILDGSCSAIPGELYLVTNLHSFRDLFLSFGVEIVGQTKNLRAYSYSGMPGDWNVTIGDIPLLQGAVKI